MIEHVLLTDALEEAGETPCMSNPDVWFAASSPAATRQAVAACKGCDVLAQCAAYALRTGQRYGVWGGMSSPDGQLLGPQRASRAEGLH